MGAKVGIFWGLREDVDPHRFSLIVDATNISEAEPYATFLTHPRGHYEVWENWRRLGPAVLAKRGLPQQIAWHEYEDFPRGRVVFNTEDNTFVIYADQRLQAPSFLSDVIRVFELETQRSVVRSDAHYRSQPML
jgi:hypothetical protein